MAALPNLKDTNSDVQSHSGTAIDVIPVKESEEATYSERDNNYVSKEEELESKELASQSPKKDNNSDLQSHPEKPIHGDNEKDTNSEIRTKLDPLHANSELGGTTSGLETNLTDNKSGDGSTHSSRKQSWWAGVCSKFKSRKEPSTIVTCYVHKRHGIDLRGADQELWRMVKGRLDEKHNISLNMAATNETLIDQSCVLFILCPFVSSLVSDVDWALEGIVSQKNMVLLVFHAIASHIRFGIESKNTLQEKKHRDLGGITDVVVWLSGNKPFLYRCPQNCQAITDICKFIILHCGAKRPGIFKCTPSIIYFVGEEREAHRFVKSLPCSGDRRLPFNKTCSRWDG